MCLDHSTGFNNFWFIEPDRKLHIHFEPGTRFSYSGEGFILLQFVIEHGRKSQGLGLDVGDLARADFQRLGMTRTSLVWQNGSDANVADGWNDQGRSQPHERRSKVRVAGSMNTTISDLARFTAALVRGDGLTAAARAEMTRRTLHITTAGQFPRFADLVRFILGDTGVPYDWEYGGRAGKSLDSRQRGQGRLTQLLLGQRLVEL
jgi:CubicO group peptidase (beta-lactamase class C family)